MAKQKSKKINRRPATQKKQQTIEGLASTQRSLKEETHLNELIIGSSPDGILIYDIKSGQCILVNDAACDVVGATKKQLLQQNFRKIESWKTGLLRAAEDAIATGLPQKTQVDLTTSFGKEAWMEATFVTFPRGKNMFLMLLMRDVLEIKRTEEQLRRKVDELTVTNRAMVGRELKMVELKKEIKELKQRLNQKA
jgi:PAS domain S-box-containing protein